MTGHFITVQILVIYTKSVPDPMLYKGEDDKNDFKSSSVLSLIKNSPDHVLHHTPSAMSRVTQVHLTVAAATDNSHCNHGVVTAPVDMMSKGGNRGRAPVQAAISRQGCLQRRTAAPVPPRCR